jgi:hypothetical protein
MGGTWKVQQPFGSWIDTLASFTRNSPLAFINFSVSMVDAKIATVDALEFLGSGHTQKSALSLQHLWINFQCWTIPRIFLMSDCNLHVRLLSDYRVFRVTVRVTEIYIKIAHANSHISWQFFKLKIWSLQFFKIFWLRLEIRIASITYF